MDLRHPVAGACAPPPDDTPRTPPRPPLPTPAKLPLIPLVGPNFAVRHVTGKRLLNAFGGTFDARFGTIDLL
ncbi:hypothetical protein GCM10017688_03090 [Streptomyces ramulosus]